MDNSFHADFYGFVIDSEQGLTFAGKPVTLHPKELNLVIAQRNFHCLLSYQINRAYVALLKG